jgi:hypothetical protein
VRLTVFVPSPFMTTISKPLTKAIFEPSGDHAGRKSLAGSLVSRV